MMESKISRVMKRRLDHVTTTWSLHRTGNDTPTTSTNMKIAHIVFGNQSVKADQT